MYAYQGHVKSHFRYMKLFYKWSCVILSFSHFGCPKPVFPWTVFTGKYHGKKRVPSKSLQPFQDPSYFLRCYLLIDLRKIYVRCWWMKKHSFQWRHNGLDGVLNHQPDDCLLNSLFRRRSKKTSKLRVTGPCVRKSPVTGEFPTQMGSNAENVSIWWSHHDYSR